MHICPFPWWCCSNAGETKSLQESATTQIENATDGVRDEVTICSVTSATEWKNSDDRRSNPEQTNLLGAHADKATHLRSRTS